MRHKLQRAVKRPLRYPGGKSRAIPQILAQIPLNIAEYREPMVGGGSVFLAIKATLSSHVQRYWINDLNYDLICFWRAARDQNALLVERLFALKRAYPEGRALWAHLHTAESQCDDLERAVRFFALNRITFSGVVDSGGYSQQAFECRFTDSAIERVRKLAQMLANVEITHGDYATLLQAQGENVFIFLDPPYWRATDSRLYGTDGILHTTFDHMRLAQALRACQHRWLATYDDSPLVRRLFSFAHIAAWQLQYGMNNVKRLTAQKGDELFIRNYEKA
ncbi:MAG: modification methylase [Candidatus Thermofonsia Clade 1 bacterium]|uniref:site-specific DNA-methyltransferase (adenine-specific) n=1 Tax=Candidatus Thermofonsia Clade 1 bacterium TaxID=2364210 RepID=A0A2M8P094_9CHLR|nr:MAG: modification methylase [Candidatus Thermofonsia Clade 1 bacterium]